jgi:uncharacterized protein
MTPDVNVLVAAFRSDHSHHLVARSWLIQARELCARGRQSLILLPMVVASFLRLVTNSRVFKDPDTANDAIAFLDAIVETPGVELSLCGSEWPVFRSLLLRLALRGNVVTDAWIAAAVQSLSENLVTFDPDFTRLLPARDLILLSNS